MKKAIVKTKLSSRYDLISTLGEIDYFFETPYWQHDRIFVPKNYDRSQSKPRLSLRTVVKQDNETIYAIVMRQHFAKTGLDVIHRTVVNDYTEAAHIIYGLGYELKAEISRRREELQMGETVRLYIDKIDNLDGFYLKIETLLDEDESPLDARQDLIETFGVLGVKDALPIDMTYGEMIESPSHDIEDIPDAGVVEGEVLEAESRNDDSEGHLKIRR